MSAPKLDNHGVDQSDRARYVVGIDLGTTNTVVAAADTWASAERPGPAPSRRPSEADSSAIAGADITREDDDDDDRPPPRPRIDVFALPQLVAPGEVEARQQLPSFRYHPAPGELTEADARLELPGLDLQTDLHPSEPADQTANQPNKQNAAPHPLPAIDGVLAQRLGGRVPGRLIASAKSWLCHAGVDREAAILPWGAPDEVPKISPVSASAGYLAHVRAAWDAAHPGHPLHEQSVVLTVPASFDEAARSLTLEAARRAGLPRLRLLEEPQAAFYDWLDRHSDDLESAIGQARLLLVLDAGGGTTDLTLIRAELAPSGPRLSRIAVGDHLLLGGDNMDHALARLCEPVLAGGSDKRLPAGRFAQLLQQCREAKQTLLAEQAPDEVRVTLLGSGSSVVGGRRSTTLTRAQAEQVLVDGFLPTVTLDARPEKRRGGLLAFGLPFVADPTISRHLTAFLARHRPEAAEALGVDPEAADAQPHTVVPDAVLFNGGVFNSPVLEARMLAVLAGLRNQPLQQLDNPDPNLAVARGAVAYGLARRGIGLRVGGGSPRSYYLNVHTEQAQHDAVCVLPRGAEEGEEQALTDGTFALRVGRPVRFGLFASTGQPTHKQGDLVALGDDYEALPDLCAVIEQRPGDGQELMVELRAQLTEVGTLEMSLVAVDQPKRRYALEFQLRGEHTPIASKPPARVGELHPRFAEATELVNLFYGKSKKTAPRMKVNTLRTELEKIIGERAGWDTPLLRELFGALLAGKKRRRRSADHERIWLNLAGYGLRPGFGYPVDEWRVGEVWPIYEQGVEHNPDAAVWAQFWILFRRIAGGLDAEQQRRIFDDLAYYLNPDTRRGPRPKGPRKQGLEEMARLLGSLERLDAETKVMLGDWLLARVARKELSQAAVYWSLARIGARELWYGSAHTVVPPEVAERWLAHLLALDLKTTDQAPFAVAQLARRTHDRARDLGSDAREQVAHALSQLPGSEAWVKRVREGGQLDDSEARRVFGEALPAGLRLPGPQETPA